MFGRKTQKNVEMSFDAKSVPFKWQAEHLACVAELLTDPKFTYCPVERPIGSESCSSYAFDKRQILFNYEYSIHSTDIDKKLVEHLHKGGAIDAFKTVCNYNGELKFLQANRMNPGDYIGPHFHLGPQFKLFASLEIIPANSGGIFGVKQNTFSKKPIELPGGPHILNICDAMMTHEVTKVDNVAGNTPRISLVLGI